MKFFKFGDPKDYKNMPKEERDKHTQEMMKQHKGWGTSMSHNPIGWASFNQIKDEVLRLPHLTGEVQAKWLFDLVKKTNDEALICEVGTYHGFLAAVMGLSCVGSSRRIVVVDHMIGDHCGDHSDRENLSVYKEFVDNMILMGIWNKIIPLPFKSFNPNITDYESLKMHDLKAPVIRTLYLGAYEMILAMGLEFDLIYLDGNHDEENVFRELELYTTVLKVGGMITGDDGIDNFSEVWDVLTIEGVPKTGGAPAAIFRFFKGNEDFTRMKSVPGNQFGFKKIR